MTPDLAWWGTLVGLLAAQAAALTLLGAAVELRVRAPQARRALWQAVLLGVSLVWGAEISGLSAKVRFPHLRKDSPTALKARLLSIPSTTEPPALAVWGNESAAAFTPEASVEDEIPAEPINMAHSAPVSPPTPVKWPGWIWLGGATVLLLRSMVARVCLACHRRRMTEAGTDTQALVSRLCGPLGLRRVSAQTWPGLRGPIAFGFWRPTVALPSDFASRFTPEQREAMLAHELAHLAGRDPLWLALADTILALAWWHPGVWWAGRRFRVAGESAADEASALVPSGPSALAESLVLFGRELATPALSRGLGVGGSGRGSDLRRRVMALLDHSGTWRRLPAGWRWSPRLAALGIAAMMAATPVRAGFSGSVFTAMSPRQSSAPNLADSTPSVPAKAAASAPTPAATEPAGQPPDTVIPTNSISASPRSAQTNKTSSLSVNSIGGGQNVEQDVSEVKKRLRRIRLKEVSFDTVPLTNVLKKLAEESIKNDPEKVGIQFVIRPAGYSPSSSTNRATPTPASVDIGGVLIRINPPLKNIILEDVLDAICVIPEEPLTYVIQNRMIVFLAMPRFDATLITRVIRLNLNTFTNALRRFSDTNQASAAKSSDGVGDGVAGGQPDPGSPIPRTELNLNELARDYFSAAGVNLAPPNSIYFNTRAGAIMVHASEPDIMAVENAIERLNVSEGGPTVSGLQQTIILPTRGLTLSDPTNLVRGVTQVVKLVAATKLRREPGPTPGGEHPGASLSAASDVSPTLYRLHGDYFRSVGLDLDSPGFVLLNERNDIILVRAREDEIQRIHTFLMDRVFKSSDPGRPPSTNESEHAALAKPGGGAETNLVIRRFKVSHASFVEGLRNLKSAGRFVVVEGDVTPAPARSAAVFAAEREAPARSANEMIRDYFAAFGVSLDPPKSVFFDDRKGKLLVRASAEDLNSIHAAVEFLGASEPGPQPAARQAQAPEARVSPPAVTLHVQFTELPEQSPGELGLDWLFGLSPTNNPAPRAGSATDLLQATNLAHTENYRVDALRTEGESATLSEAQFQMLLHTLEQREGVDLLSAPTIKTFSGRKARIEIRDVKTIVSGAVTTDASSTNKNQASINYLTEQIGVGPMFEVTPVAEGRAWRLTALAGLTEFLGYDKPKKGDDYVVSTGGKPVHGDKPYPHFRALEARASALVSPGQTLALRGPSYGVTNKVKGGLFRKAKTEVSRKRIYIFVTVEQETATANAADENSPLVISIAKTPPFFSVGSKTMTIEEVRSLLAAEIARDSDLEVQFRPDGGAPISEILKVVDVAKEARIKVPPSLLVAPGSN